MAQFVAYDAFLGALQIGQVTQCDFNGEPRTERHAAAGATETALVSAIEAEPKATIRTADLLGVLAGIPISGATAGLHVDGAAVVLPWNRRAGGGTFDADDHYTISSDSALILPTEISARQGDKEALAQLMIHFRSSNGFENPVAENPNQVLTPSLFNAVYSLGPMVLDGNQVLELTGTTVETGLEPVTSRANGGIYVDFLSVMTPFKPRIRIPTRDIAQFAGGTGNSIFQELTTVTQFFLRRLGVGHSDGGDHIAITLTGGLTVHDSTSGSGDESAERNTIFEGLSLSVATGVAAPIL